MKTFVGTLIVGLIVAIFTYSLNAEKVDVRYSLSERIPTRLLEEKATESIQYLEIFNTGNAEAKQVRIVIAARISSYELRKYSNADIPREFRTKESLEILYPTLPPSGSIKLLIKSIGTGINKASLEISHSRGKAEEAFAKSGMALFISYSFVIWLIVVLGSMFLSIRISLIDTMEFKAKYDADALLRKKRPFYVNTDKWYKVRRTALENKIERGWDISIEKSESYNILSIEKPNYLNDEEWIAIKKAAIEHLTNKISKESYGAWKAGRLLELMRLRRPSNFPDKEWQAIIKDLNEKYFATIKKDALFPTVEIALAMLKQKKPDAVIDDYWAEHLKQVRSEYLSRLFQSVASELEPMQYVEKCDLDVLNEEEKKKLRSFAYAIEVKKYFKFGSLRDAEDLLKTSKPKWMTDKDYELLLSQAKDAVNVKAKQSKTDAIMRLLQGILNKQTLLSQKPNELTAEEWAEIERIDKDIRIRSQEIDKKEREIATEQTKIITLKEKVLRQLQIIDDIFKDPKSITKIEEYDNAFAPGNFSNLRTLAEVLSKAI